MQYSKPSIELYQKFACLNDEVKTEATMFSLGVKP